MDSFDMRGSFEELEPDGRFSRQQGLQGWSQGRLERSRCLVVGAGALGNELLKNLALLGVGSLGIVDFDCVEESNLPRCALFRLGDIGGPKADVAKERLLELAPGLNCAVYRANVLTEIGAGLIAEYDLVLGAVDSIAARWQINRLSRRAGVPWIDAGVDRFCGQVARFDPAEGACYECGLTGPMWQRIFERFSCSAPGEPVAARPYIPVALPIVSLTAAIQAQEAVRLLMVEDRTGTAQLGPGERVSFSMEVFELLRLQGRQRESCLAHAADRTAAVTTEFSQQDMVGRLLHWAGARSLELEWEVVRGLHCGCCGFRERIMPVWQLRQEMLVCAGCGGALVPEQTGSIALGSRLAECRLGELGVPAKAHLQLLVGEGAGACWYKIL